MQTLKLYGKESQRRELWVNRATKTMNLSIESQKMSILFGIFQQLIFGVQNILIIYLGATAIMGNEMSIGVLLAFISYKGQLEQSAGGLVEQLVKYKMLSIHLDRLSDILLTHKDDRLTGTMKAEQAPDGSFKMEGICYRHKQDEPLLLKNVALTVAAGETVAIIGPSGCGKTTLMKIMVGLLYPEDGNMYLGKHSQVELGTQVYRDHIATVMQDDQLLSGSILENIAFFDPEPDIARVEAAAVMANIAEDIVQMPMQFNTLVGDMGTTLSGGQKQRLLVARAIYKQPKYLFLDESTSHLDKESEMIVNINLKRMKLTTILIAHRRETILAANRILRLEDGGLVDVTQEYRGS
jgi:ATP-binding cassette subfamily B protein RaxB